MAEIARLQRRKVFVLEPKEVNDQAKRGYKSLLKKGTTPIKSYKDVLDFLKDETTQLPPKGNKKDSFTNRH